MNTNPTAVSLAVVLHNVEKLYALGVPNRDRRNAMLTALDAVEAIANRNGNSIAGIREIARTLTAWDTGDDSPQEPSYKMGGPA